MKQIVACSPLRTRNSGMFSLVRYPLPDQNKFSGLSSVPIRIWPAELPGVPGDPNRMGPLAPWDPTLMGPQTDGTSTPMGPQTDGTPRLASQWPPWDPSRSRPSTGMGPQREIYIYLTEPQHKIPVPDMRLHRIMSTMSLGPQQDNIYAPDGTPARDSGTHRE